MGYKRFTCAADAIRYAIEEMPAEFLAGAFLEVREERFDGPEIRRLYERPDYPLKRARRTPPAAEQSLPGNAEQPGRKKS